MSDERIEAMKQFIEQAPDNPFPRYALAMEFKSAQRLEEAVDTLGHLATHAPDYVATYLQWGMLLEQLGREDEARRAFEAGIEWAGKKGDQHALSELQGALSALD